MAKSKNKYFVVWEGKQPGIYTSWEACKKQVHGCPEAKYKGFATEAEAQEAFHSSYWNYVGKNAKKTVPNKALIAEYGKPDLESISVDAA
ncbi:MAG TPA: RNase H1/viroplasmin domain-containing protein, partial [Paludibacter sp.]|nr:RNase H1/viroplasmin domain-containing protein [Paludibacter sp.]